MRLQGIDRNSSYLTTSDFKVADVGNVDDVIIVSEISLLNISSNTRSVEAWVVDSSDNGNMIIQPFKLYPNDHQILLPNIKLGKNESLILKGEGTVDIVCTASGLRFRR